MKSIPFYKSNGLYVAASFASANSFFFSKVEECEILYSNIRRYLYGMIDVVEIRCFPGGWILLFQTKTSFDIKRAYQRHNKNKEKARCNDVEHILSEQFRIVNSMTVRACNRLCNRTGSRVHSKLVKMIFEGKSDYYQFLEKMENIKVFSNQELISFYPEFGKMVMDCGMYVEDLNRKAKPKKGSGNVRRLLKKYNSFTMVFRKHYISFKCAKSQQFKALSTHVALELIQSTKNHHKRLFRMRFSVFELP